MCFFAHAAVPLEHQYDDILVRSVGMFYIASYTNIINNISNIH